MKKRKKKRIGKPLYIVQSEITIEETILNYRKLELQRLKSNESFLTIIKNYEEMNKSLEHSMNEFHQKRKEFTIQQLNYSITNDNRFLPNIFQMTKNVSFPPFCDSTNPSSFSKDQMKSKKGKKEENGSQNEFHLNELTALANGIKLPAPPITLIDNEMKKPKESKEMKEIKETKRMKEAKENDILNEQVNERGSQKGTQKEMKTSKKHQMKIRRKLHMNSTNSTEGKEGKEKEKSDTDTVVSSCSDTIEEEMSNVSEKYSSEKKRKHQKETKPKKTSSMKQSRKKRKHQSEQKDQKEKKEQKEKKKQQEELTSLLNLGVMTKFPNEKTGNTFEFQPLKLQGEKLFQPKSIDLKETLFGLKKKDEKETKEMKEEEMNLSDDEDEVD